MTVTWPMLERWERAAGRDALTIDSELEVLVQQKLRLK